jgi:hypothetical protein
VGDINNGFIGCTDVLVGVEGIKVGRIDGRSVEIIGASVVFEFDIQEFKNNNTIKTKLHEMKLIFEGITIYFLFFFHPNFPLSTF